MEVEEWRAARREELGAEEAELPTLEPSSNLRSTTGMGSSSSVIDGGHGSDASAEIASFQAYGSGGSDGAAAMLQRLVPNSTPSAVPAAASVSVAAKPASLGDCRPSSSTTSSSNQPPPPTPATNASRPSTAAGSCSTTSFSSTTASTLAASSAVVGAVVSSASTADESAASKVDAVADQTSASVQAEWDLSEVFPEGPSLEDLRIAIAAGKERPMVSPGRSKGKRRAGRHVRRDVWS